MVKSGILPQNWVYDKKKKKEAKNNICCSECIRKDESKENMIFDPWEWISIPIRYNKGAQNNFDIWSFNIEYLIH